MYCKLENYCLGNKVLENICYPVSKASSELIESYSYICNSVIKNTLLNYLPSLNKFINIEDKNTFNNFIEWCSVNNYPKD